MTCWRTASSYSTISVPPVLRHAEQPAAGLDQQAQTAVAAVELAAGLDWQGALPHQPIARPPTDQPTVRTDTSATTPAAGYFVDTAATAAGYALAPALVAV